jgi:lipoprotein-anchoring transpeptidase ErfK/SrfK
MLMLGALLLIQLHSAQPAGQPSNGERIVVNVADRTLSIMKDGKTAAAYPVAIGKPGTPTPAGEFHVLLLDPHPASRTGVYGTRWIEFFRRKERDGVLWRYGIHGTNEPGKIGGAVSHGCIRLSNHDIEEVFQRAYVGEAVTVLDTPGTR